MRIASKASTTPSRPVANPGESFTTSFANAPKADLYGIELEAQKYLRNLRRDAYVEVR